MTTTPNSACALCGLSPRSHAIVDDGHHFCCPGCHAVFHILKARNELEDYEESPVFQRAVHAGLISNPTLLDRLRERRSSDDESGERHKIYLEITDLWCPSCAQVIEWITLDMKGVYRCTVDYTTDLAVVEFSPLKTSKEAIIEAIKKVGYHAVALDDRVEGKVSRSLYLRFVIAAFCALNIMMFSYPIYASYFDADAVGFAPLFAWLSFAMALPVMTYCSWPLFQRGWAGLRAGFYGMESLVSLAVLAAFGYSTYELFLGDLHLYYDALAVIITFVLLGKIIETRAKFTAKESLLQLARYLPRRARRRAADGTESFVWLKEIQPGDLLVVLLGEKIVLDGVVVEGEATVDESLMTGESLPVSKKAGEDVLSGTMIRQGRLVYRVATTQEQSMLQQIVGMVEHDLQHKGRYVRAADVVARWFVPVVVAIAVTTAVATFLLGTAEPGQGILETAILRAVAVLVISCPCSIGIAGPLAESLLMSSLASMGAVVRNRACLRYLGKETSVIFDKTGTVTRGRFEVHGGLDVLTGEQRQIVQGLAKQSIHPLSTAISAALQEPAVALEQVEELPGRGLRGMCQGKWYYLGSEALLQQFGMTPLPDQIGRSAGIASHVLFAGEGRCLTRIVLSDSLREGAVAAVQGVHPAQSLLISGDAVAAVANVAKSCQFTSWRAGCSPLEKRQVVEELRTKGEVVAMLGDGINDAPALTGAHVGISMVSAADVSIQVSDILLTSDRLDLLTTVRKQGCRGRRIVTENLIWAFSYNIIGIPLAALGLLTPIYSAVAMVASSLFVIFNALRLAKVAR